MVFAAAAFDSVIIYRWSHNNELYRKQALMDWLIIPAIVTLGLQGHNSAATSAGVAYFKQSGVEQMLNDYQERQLSQELRARMGDVFLVARTVIDQRITLEFKFP